MPKNALEFRKTQKVWHFATLAPMSEIEELGVVGPAGKILGVREAPRSSASAIWAHSVQGFLGQTELEGQQQRRTCAPHRGDGGQRPRHAVPALAGGFSQDCPAAEGKLGEVSQHSGRGWRLASLPTTSWRSCPKPVKWVRRGWERWISTSFGCDGWCKRSWRFRW